jgi:hypothetical protein
MKKLDKFVKRKGDELHVTSLNLEAKHLAFLRTKNINLSALVREYLDRLIVEAGKN